MDEQIEGLCRRILKKHSAAMETLIEVANSRRLALEVGSEVKVTLEIEAEMPGGASEQVVRTVTENGRTLSVTSRGTEVQ